MIVIIDYGMGNLASVEKAINKIGRDVIISDDVNIISKASIIILPGVGSFEQGMKNLIQRNLVNVLSNEVIKKKKKKKKIIFLQLNFIQRKVKLQDWSC